MIKIKDFGSFYIGGRELDVQGRPLRRVSRGPGLNLDIDENGKYFIEQSYVQYFIPEGSEIYPPIIFIHGGGLTGTSWETTPDGRKGWLQYFLEQGLSVYVVDNVGRGRAGWSPFWSENPEIRSVDNAWRDYRLGNYSEIKEKKPFHGQKFNTKSLRNLSMFSVPRWNCDIQPSIKNLRLLIKKLGECILVGHSQGASFALEAILDGDSSAIGAVLLEPLPIPKIQDLDLSEVEDKKFLFMYGDHFNKHPLWKNTKYQGKKVSEALINLGASVSWEDLPASGIDGNSHMLMMDQNNIKLADMVLSWIDECKKPYSKSMMTSRL